MMSILKEMGIQQWRIRQRTPSIEPELHAVQPAVVRDSLIEDVEVGTRVEETITTEPRADVTLETGGQSADLPSLNVVPIAAPLAQSNSNTPALGTSKAIQDPIAELDWQGLQNLVDGQSQCLSCGQGKSLLGNGDPNANWLFVVDAPHSQDLSSQQLFNSRAGQLFDAMLSAVGLERSLVYVTSVFKCIASEDLSQSPTCDRILHRQIELIQPEVVITLGEFAAQAVIKANESLEILRTNEQACFRTKAPIVPTYTPAQLLDEPSLKGAVWQDLKRCLSISSMQK